MFVCSVCCKGFASWEKDLVRFSDNSFTHKGNCERKYLETNTGLSISLDTMPAKMEFGKPVVIKPFAFGASG